MTEQIVTPYSTVTGLAGTVKGATLTRPSWILNELEQERVFSYQLYEQIYWGVPDTFKLVARGTEDKPIYLPSGRKIVDTCDRYVGNNLTWQCSSPEGQAFFDLLFARETFLSAYQGNKLYGIMRGDWCWHITGNELKLPGTRITIRALDPGSYFPIFDPDDVDRVIGCHIVELIDDEGEITVKRQTYRKTELGITSEIAQFKLDEWGDPESEPIKIIKPVFLLPPEITALPVYHIKNMFEPQNPFGSSEMRGFERVIGAINQSISDEDLTLAMDGLGVYTTNAVATDEEGEAAEWDIGPAKVIELSGTRAETFFERVSGIGSVVPFQDHIRFLQGELMSGSGTPDIAAGKVDVQVAESGVALLLQMGPILSKAEKKDTLLLGTTNQMFYDLINGWVPAYEKVSFEATLTAHVGDKLPLNRKQRFDELVAMITLKVIDTQYFRDEMKKLGYIFPDDLAQRVQQEASLLVDPVTARLNAELAAQTDTGQ